MTGTCVLCGMNSPDIASELNICLACLRERPEAALEHCAQAHERSRASFNLPAAPSRSEGGLHCGLCAQDCVLGSGERGFCGLRVNRDGRLVHLAGTPQRGLLHWYRDPLPTNCVADWVCPGHTQAGMHNLAVFYASCTLNCLFCQNWHFRETDPRLDRQGATLALSAAELADCANPRTYCACFFGGDPASQMPHALAAGHALAALGVRVCWETAGTMHPNFLQCALDISFESGGCIKFDLKAYDENLHIALTGASNQRTLENFRTAAERALTRPEPPLVIASTLLVPGYVDPQEVGRIARFIAGINPEIPYALLGFFPHFYMHDLPTTSVEHARAAEEAAREAGLKNVRLGNRHLLGMDYELL
jgi:pyruvate formate lyase activating enzyme